MKPYLREDHFSGGRPRDPARSGKIDEIAIGAIDSNYSTYLFYESVEAFMANYVALPEPKAALETVSEVKGKPSLVKLKTARMPFRPPEISDSASEGRSDKKA